MSLYSWLCTVFIFTTFLSAFCFTSDLFFFKQQRQPHYIWYKFIHKFSSQALRHQEKLTYHKEDRSPSENIFAMLTSYKEMFLLLYSKSLDIIIFTHIAFTYSALTRRNQQRTAWDTHLLLHEHFVPVNKATDVAKQSIQSSYTAGWKIYLLLLFCF